MKTIIYILVLLSLIACNSIDSKVMNDPKYTGGFEYETQMPIKPKITKFGNYTFVSGYSDTAATLGMYYNNEQLNIWTSLDGYFDTIMEVNLNNDNLLDFIFESAYEDGSTLYALISKSEKQFEVKKVSDNYHGVYCGESGDTLSNLQPLIVKDIDGDGNNEILINLVKFNEELVSISCTDTFYINK